jgi:hypothetical protein
MIISKIKIALLTLSLSFTSCAIFAQTPLIVDAGSDKIICSTQWGVDTTIIGGQPSAMGGIPPYTYSWQFKYPIPFSNTGITIYGSELLNDTTLANPKIVNPTWGNELDLPYMVLTVTDSVGTIASDSIHLIFSVFAFSLMNYSFYLVQGDSISFEEGPDIFYGVGPLTYLWQPSHGLSDSTKAYNFWMKPDYSISYYAIATDSVGCSATGDPNLVRIVVFPVGIEDCLPNTNFKVYPNPATDYLQIEINNTAVSDNTSFTLFNMLGKKVYSTQITSNQQQIDVSQLARGNYSYIIGEFQGKIILR